MPDLMASIGPEWTAVLLGAPFLALVLGFVFGRRTGNLAARARELRAQLEAAHKESERAVSELAASRDELVRVQEEHAAYRATVGEHFGGTSERLRELTLQYRSVYEHLANGARSLCPEGFRELEGGLGLDALPTTSGIAEALPGEDGFAGDAGEGASAADTDDDARDDPGADRPV